MKNTHEGVLLFNKVGGFSLQFTQSTTSLYVFFTFFKLHKWYQIAQNVSVKVSRKNMDLSELQFPSISENQFRNLKHIGDYWPAYKILFNMCLQAFKTYIVENFCQICKIKCTFHSPKTRFLWVTKINTGNFHAKCNVKCVFKIGENFHSTYNHFHNILTIFLSPQVKRCTIIPVDSRVAERLKLGS